MEIQFCSSFKDENDEQIIEESIIKIEEMQKISLFWEEGKCTMHALGAVSYTEVRHGRSIEKMK